MEDSFHLQRRFFFAMALEADRAELARLLYHPGIESGSLDGDWSQEDDRRLMQVVRHHLFDFAAAAVELERDADSCRHRWAALDQEVCHALSAQLADDLSATDPTPSAPSGFNVFEDSLGDRISNIFSGVRSSLPTIDLSDDESDDNDSSTESGGAVDIAAVPVELRANATCETAVCQACQSTLPQATIM